MSSWWFVEFENATTSESRPSSRSAPRRCPPPSREQPILAEHAAGAAGLGHAVGVEEERVAGTELARDLLAGDVEEGRREERAGGIEQDGAIGAGPDDRLGMARVDVRQLAPAGGRRGHSRA